LERSLNDSIVVKGASVCDEQCFVSRNNLTGYGSCLNEVAKFNYNRNTPGMAINYRKFLAYLNPN